VTLKTNNTPGVRHGDGFTIVWRHDCKFLNGFFTLKTLQMFSFRFTPENFENAANTGRYVLEMCLRKTLAG